MREIFVECDVYSIFLAAASFFQKGVPEYREGRARNREEKKERYPCPSYRKKSRDKLIITITPHARMINMNFEDEQKGHGPDTVQRSYCSHWLLIIELLSKPGVYISSK